jgi:hypothetical protein
MLTFGVALSDCFRDRREWFNGFGLERIANLVGLCRIVAGRKIRRSASLVLPFIAIVFTHNKQLPP